jgi:hypothetical protein
MMVLGSKCEMVSRAVAVLVALLCIETVAQGQVLQDDFNGSAINTSLWNTSTPFSDSSITESGGFAVFQNRGRLSTAAAMPSVLDIRGRFSFVGNVHDSFQVDTRTDGTSVNHYGGFDRSLVFGFVIQNDLGQTTGNIGIHHNLSGDTNYLEVAQGTFPLALNTFYDFRITDDGTNVALYIGDLTTPFLTGTDTIASGNKLGIFNREGTGGGSSISDGSIVHLDYLTVVPEPTTWSLLAVGIGALLSGLQLGRRSSSMFWRHRR